MTHTHLTSERNPVLDGRQVIQNINLPLVMKGHVVIPGRPGRSVIRSGRNTGVYPYWMWAGFPAGFHLLGGS